MNETLCLDSGVLAEIRVSEHICPQWIGLAPGRQEDSTAVPIQHHYNSYDSRNIVACCRLNCYAV